jgi:hypothetical protein
VIGLCRGSGPSTNAGPPAKKAQRFALSLPDTALVGPGSSAENKAAPGKGLWCSLLRRVNALADAALSIGFSWGGLCQQGWILGGTLNTTGFTAAEKIQSAPSSTPESTTHTLSRCPTTVELQPELPQPKPSYPTK